MYRLVLGPAPANSARLTSTKPSFRKWRPDLSSTRIETRHLHASRRPELGLAVILVGKTKVLLYLTQWFCTSILRRKEISVFLSQQMCIFVVAESSYKSGFFKDKYQPLIIGRLLSFLERNIELYIIFLSLILQNIPQ